MQRIVEFWKSGIGKVVVGLGGLILLACSCSLCGLIAFRSSESTPDPNPRTHRPQFVS
jgi:hypothetical protein